MILAIPVDGNTTGACINKALGRTPFFLFYDTETKENTFVENTAANSQGGAGVKAAQLVIDNCTSAVITPSCGKNSADVFLAAEINLYMSQGCSVKDNIAAFESGKLKTLDNIHAGFHNHGGS